MTSKQNPATEDRVSRVSFADWTQETLTLSAPNWLPPWPPSPSEGLTMLHDLRAIRAANPLPSIVGVTVNLKPVGEGWKGCFPFHNDRTPSFTIFANGERFHCFGCGVKGDQCVGAIVFVAARQSSPNVHLPERGGGVVQVTIRAYKGQLYVRVDDVPHRTRDGRDTLLTRWWSTCADCGAAFVFATSSLARKFQPNRRCANHKRPGIRAGEV